MGFLHLDPVQHGTKIVAEMEVSGGLHAGENAGCELAHGLDPEEWMVARKRDMPVMLRLEKCYRRNIRANSVNLKAPLTWATAK